MSSTPIQFLTDILRFRKCSAKPLILPLPKCFLYRTGKTIRSSLYVMHFCDITESEISNITFQKEIFAMTIDALSHPVVNQSLYSVTIEWSPKSNLTGTHELCAIAYTT